MQGASSQMLSVLILYAQWHTQEAPTAPRQGGRRQASGGAECSLESAQMRCDRGGAPALRQRLHPERRPYAPVILVAAHRAQRALARSTLVDAL